jgi:hypothetical protein
MSVSLRIPACRTCGTWVCNRCGWRRGTAARHWDGVHTCHKCQGTSGHFDDVRHTNRATREDHELLADQKGWR